MRVVKLYLYKWCENQKQKPDCNHYINVTKNTTATNNNICCVSCISMCVTMSYFLVCFTMSFFHCVPWICCVSCVLVCLVFQCISLCPLCFAVSLVYQCVLLCPLSFSVSIVYFPLFFCIFSV